MSTETTIPIVQLIVFAILFQPSIYVLWKHGKHGILGWLYLQAFCALRVVGSIMQILSNKNHSTNKNALLIGSVGLSPLLLATLGILHEARRAKIADLRTKLEWFLVISLHALIGVAMTLIITGVMKVQSGTITSPHDSLFMKLGIAILILCWVLLAAWSLLSTRAQHNLDQQAFAYGYKLLNGVILALPFIGLRVAYAALSYFLTTPDFSTSMRNKIAMNVVSEMVITVVLVVVGIATRNMWKPKPKKRSIEFGSYESIPTREGPD